MGNSLVIRTEASYTLNYLVYLQNLFQNQKNYDGTEYKFPYLPSKQLAFVIDFETQFKELWDKMSERLAVDYLVDTEIFRHEKERIHQKLFVPSDENMETYNEIYQTFDVWARSLAGRFAIESAVNEERLYHDVVHLLSQQNISPQKRLQISVVYDPFPLGNREELPYFVVISIEEYLAQYEKVVAKLGRSIQPFCNKK